MIPTIGQMRMVLTFRQVEKTSDDRGGQTESYSDLFTTRGYYTETRAFRKEETGFDADVKRFKLFVYWRAALESNINKDTRVKHEDREFKIETFSLVDQKRKIYRMDLTEVK